MIGLPRELERARASSRAASETELGGDDERNESYFAGSSADAAAMSASCCLTVLLPGWRRLLATGSRLEGEVILEYSWPWSAFDSVRDDLKLEYNWPSSVLDGTRGDLLRGRAAGT